ncbi:MAG: M20/M25/M40 family metallo-hydrolase [Planctomycetota bacterium]|nr:M20/M25/M40 family metallo-hydrolase [Planctomycetota bacterium]MDA1214148.1 M20/M25/M40 family metallo-hydrolase [Planctomycetota bacterium]
MTSSTTASLTTFTFNERKAVERVIDMIAIAGKSCEEKAIADFIEQKLLAAGVPASAIVYDRAHKLSSYGGNVGNLIVKLPGTKPGPRRMLMGHIDTVPLCVGAQPVQRGNKIVSKSPSTALGGDNRAGAAIVLTAILEILKQKLPHPPLTLFWPVQEEIGLLGAKHVALNKLGKPKLCFNWDGGDAQITCIGATGGYELFIEIEGIASHAGGHPEAGVNAISIASLAIADLVKNGWHGLVLKNGLRGTSNIGVIQGGDATNVVTSKVSLRGEARSHDRKFRSRIVKEIQQAFQRAVKQLKNSSGKTGKLTFSAELKYDSFQLSTDEPCVQSAIAAVKKCGLNPELRISNGGLDANWTSALGLPTVTLGAGQHDIHTTAEWLDVPSFLKGCQIGLLIATASE